MYVYFTSLIYSEVSSSLQMALLNGYNTDAKFGILNIPTEMATTQSQHTSRQGSETSLPSPTLKAVNQVCIIKIDIS